MNEQDDTRLQDIVRSVLELAPDADVTAASQPSVPTWDSLAHVTLMLAVESEFGVAIDVDSQVRLTSYAAIRQYLEARGT